MITVAEWRRRNMKQNLREAMYAILYAEGEKVIEKEKARSIEKAISYLKMELNETYEDKTEETLDMGSEIRNNIHQKIGEKTLQGTQNSFDFHVVYKSYHAAESDFCKLSTILKDHGKLSIKDLKDLCLGESSKEEERWGWVDGNCSLRLIRNGFFWEIVIPENPVKLDEDKELG